MNKLFFLIVLLCTTTMCFSQEAVDVLAKVDATRAIGTSFKFHLKIEDYSKGELSQTAIMEGYIKGENKTMVQYKEPSAMRGKKILLVDDDLFIFVPKTQRPVRMTSSQRLMGQTSNGDVMNVRFQTDYSSVRKGEEKLQIDNVMVNCLILDLSAKRKSSTYNTIRLWVDSSSFYPIKAECYALSGKKMKTVEYSLIKNFENKAIVSRAIFRDHVIQDNYTVIEFLDMTTSVIPDNYFNKEYLLRM